MKRMKVFLVMLMIMILGMFSFSNAMSRVYSINGDLKEKIEAKSDNYVGIDKIPENLKNAVVAVEDRRFYRHVGFDVIGIGRAFVRNMQAGKVVEGASTITQQLAKNLYLTNERSYKRKVKELIIAMKLESEYSKNEILEMYLNVVYFGAGAYGIQNASETFFGKDVEELSLAESAMLAGLPQAPSAYNPKEHLDKAQKRQQVVLSAMARNGYILEGEKVRAEQKMVAVIVK